MSWIRRKLADPAAIRTQAQEWHPQRADIRRVADAARNSPRSPGEHLRLSIAGIRQGADWAALVQQSTAPVVSAARRQPV